MMRRKMVLLLLVGLLVFLSSGEKLPLADSVQAQVSDSTNAAILPEFVRNFAALNHDNEGEGMIHPSFPPSIKSKYP